MIPPGETIIPGLHRQPRNFAKQLTRAAVARDLRGGSIVRNRHLDTRPFRERQWHEWAQDSMFVNGGGGRGHGGDIIARSIENKPRSLRLRERAGCASQRVRPLCRPFHLRKYSPDPFRFFPLLICENILLTLSAQFYGANSTGGAAHSAVKAARFQCRIRRSLWRIFSSTTHHSTP